MRTLADEWRCDASNVTFLVDRLERLGLVTRTASTTDRRVKTVTLTPEGARTRDLIQSQGFQPPPAFLRLSRAQLQAVIDAFETVAPTP